MSQFLTRVMALALLGAVLLACGGGRSSRPGSRPAERTALEVDNQSFNDLNIFVVNASQRIRLGRATAHMKSLLTIPHTVIGGARELQFLAEPITRRGGAVSNRMWVEPGDTVRLFVPPGS